MNILHIATLYWANYLQVDQPRSVANWMVRCVVRRSSRRTWVNHRLQEVPDPTHLVRGLLGIDVNAPWYWWLWRLFVMPSVGPANHRQLRNACQRLGDALGMGVRWTIKWVWNMFAWPINQAMYWLGRLGARIDGREVRRHAEQLKRPLQLHPHAPWVVFAVGLALLWQVTTTPLNVFSQAVFVVLIWALSIVLLHMRGPFAALSLATLSLITMSRYAWWRIDNTLSFDTHVEALLGYVLLAAEAYTWVVVVFGFIQTAWPLRRKPLALPADTALWPTVDVYIPTYNEPLSVVQPTVLAAMGLDWPKDKLKVYILDDGRRESFQHLAQELGVGYITRDNNQHAKAGNLNHALTVTRGDYVAIFDCDHIPVRSFLTSTCGWLYADTKYALVQTPHHFFSPDPFERNLGTFKKVPNEGALFYGLVQDGNDFWNATFFCGSCAVLRRSALMEIGGIAVETVTEDAHTALKLHRKGYKTAYIGETLAAGLATESLSAHIGQRIRWARGMAQIFRLDNPFLGKGLSVPQRICYANAMLHFFFGLPRLIFLVAPLAYLFFELNIISTLSTMLLLYAIPYIVQANIANSYRQGPYRHSFWSEVYETVLAWYIAIPTTVALFAPKLGKFNVTVKGGVIEKSYFNWKIAVPYSILIFFNISGFLYGLWRLLDAQDFEVMAILINLVWCLYGIIILGVAIAVASESRQVRRMHRVTTKIPASVYFQNGKIHHALCTDFSMGGLGMRLQSLEILETGSLIHVSLHSDGVERIFPARVALHSPKGFLGVELVDMSVHQQKQYVQCTFARKEAWSNWSENQLPNKSSATLQRIAEISWDNYKNFFAFSVKWFQKMLRLVRSEAIAENKGKRQL